MAELHVIEDGKSAKTATDTSAEDVQNHVAWINEDGEIDAAALVKDIQEHNEWITFLRVARDMRKTVLRCLVVKSGRLSMDLGDVKVFLRAREDIVCACHRLQAGECGTPIEELRLEKRVIDEPMQRDVVIEDAAKKISRERGSA